MCCGFKQTKLLISCTAIHFSRTSSGCHGSSSAHLRHLSLFTPTPVWMFILVDHQNARCFSCSCCRPFCWVASVLALTC
uniref:Uncharacterized protein n=1 Tax=Tetraselmis sp. GSL018 TaxID=582737 RepID=A0A061RLH5_9CHLO